MYLTTCINCGNIWEDTNPSDDSKDYAETAENLQFTPLEQGEDADGEGYSHHCPTCKTDSYLVDNKQETISE